MRRHLNPEITIGFLAGIIFLLFIVSVTSYQAERCAKVNESAQSNPNPKQEQTVPRSETENREKEISYYAVVHPWACGVLGFPYMTVNYLDVNEGFFVGIFTMALFIATFFLWKSTEKLWAAGEKQISEIVESNRLTREHFISDQRPWVKILFDFDGDPIWNNGFIELPISIRLDNVGKGIALGAIGTSMIYFRNEPWPEKFIEARESAKFHCRNRFGSYDLYPGEDYVIKSKIVFIGTPVLGMGWVRKPDYIIVCCAYASTHADTIYEHSSIVEFGFGHLCADIPTSETELAARKNIVRYKRHERSVIT